MNFCSGCGKPVTVGDKSCPGCGTPVVAVEKATSLVGASAAPVFYAGAPSEPAQIAPPAAAPVAPVGSTGVGLKAPSRKVLILAGSAVLLVTVVAVGGLVARNLTSGGADSPAQTASKTATATTVTRTRGPVSRVTGTIIVNGPNGVAVDGSAHRAYVISADGTVSVIDTQSNTVTDTITVGRSPSGVAVDVSAHAAYVANVDDGTVSVIDTRSNTVTDTIAVRNARAVALYGPAHTAYVTSNDGDSDRTVSVIDTRTNTVTDTITVGLFPTGVAVDVSAHTAYVTSGSAMEGSGRGTVSVIDTRSNTVTDTIIVGESPSGVAVDVSTHTAYVVNYRSGTVSVLDTRSNTVTDTIIVGKNPTGVAVDGLAHTAYVASGGSGGGPGGEPIHGTVSVIDTRSNIVTDTITVGESSRDVAVDPTTGTVYVGDLFDKVSVLAAG